MVVIIKWAVQNFTQGYKLDTGRCINPRQTLSNLFTTIGDVVLTHSPYLYIMKQNITVHTESRRLTSSPTVMFPPGSGR